MFFYWCFQDYHRFNQNLICVLKIDSHVNLDSIFADCIDAQNSKIDFLVLHLKFAVLAKVIDTLVLLITVRKDSISTRADGHTCGHKCLSEACDHEFSFTAY